MVRAPLLVVVMACAACARTEPSSADAAVTPASDPDPARADGAPVPDDAAFVQTAITVDADGAHMITRAITAGEERARNAARDARRAGAAAPLIAVDPSCGDDSLWIYDREDWTGDVVCLRGAGTTDVHFRWPLERGSFYAGIEAGWLRPRCLTGDAGPGARWFVPWDHSTFDFAPCVLTQVELQ